MTFLFFYSNVVCVWYIKYVLEILVLGHGWVYCKIAGLGIVFVKQRSYVFWSLSLQWRWYFLECFNKILVLLFQDNETELGIFWLTADFMTRGNLCWSQDVYIDEPKKDCV